MLIAVKYFKTELIKIGLLRKDQKTYMVVLVYIWFGLKNSEGLNIDLHYLRKCVGLHLV